MLHYECIMVSGWGSWLLSIGFLLPLLDLSSYLQFEYQGCVSNPKCEVKNKSVEWRVYALGVFLYEKHCNPKLAILPVSSCEDVGGKDPGLWLEVKSPSHFHARTQWAGSTAAWFFSWCWCDHCLTPALVAAFTHVRCWYCDQDVFTQLFWVKKPFPWGLLGCSAAHWTWPVQLFGCSASGLWFFVDRKSSSKAQFINLQVALRRHRNVQ